MKKLTIAPIIVFILAQFALAAQRDFYQIQVYWLDGKASVIVAENMIPVF
jgi:hypothetical protein